MQRCTLEELEARVTVRIKRLWNSAFNTYLLISSGILGCSYLIWRNPEHQVLHTLLLPGGLLGGLFIFVVWQMWRMLPPDVWIFDRQSGHIEHNGRTVESLAHLTQVVLERERDRWGNDPDYFNLYLVVHHDRRIKMASGHDAKVAWAQHGEGHELETMAQRIAEVLKVGFVREGY